MSVINAASPKLTDRILKAIHSGELKDGQIDVQFHKELTRFFTDGLKETFDDSISYDSTDHFMREYLRTNLHQFSGAKSLSMYQDIRAQLQDENGKVKPFSAFKNDVLKINTDYNTTWLNSEYNQAIAQAQHASNWQEYEADKEIFPNLEYITVGDDRVRDPHEAMNGMIRPVDDPIWNTYAPQNGWGCRCELGQRDGDVRITPKADAEKRTKGAIKSKVFKFNPGKSGAVFKDDHPYYSNAGNISEFKGVENYGLKEAKKIFADKSKLPDLKEGIVDQDSYNNWWAKMVKDKGTSNDNEFVIKSAVSGVKILFDSEAFKLPFTRKIKDESIHLIADDMPSVLRSSDEVYSTYVGRNKNGKKDIETQYIKYFDNGAFVITTDTINSENIIRVKSWEIIKDNDLIDEVRKGILMHKK